MKIIYSLISPKSLAKTSSLMFLFALLFTNWLSAGIRHTLLDTTISAPTLGDHKEFHLDLNQDGVSDFFFNHGNQWGDLVCEIYSEPNANSNEILVSNSIPTMLSSGETIAGDLSEWLNTYNGIGTNALYFMGNWPGAAEKFVAVRFKINNIYHYGWISVSIPEDSTAITIKDCAYEDIPGQSIIAGDIGTPVVEEEDSLNPFIYNHGKIIYIECNEKSEGYIYDINGNRVLSFICDKPINYIELDRFNNGVYFLHLSYGDKFKRKILNLY